MNRGYWETVDRQAHDILDQLRTGRTATFPGRLPEDVRRRLDQLAEGDDTPIAGDPADE